MIKIILFCFFVGMTSSTFAERGGAQKGTRIGVGGIVGVSSKLIYKRGSKNHFMGLPFMTIFLGNLTIKGPELAYRLIGNPIFSVSLIGDFFGSPPLKGMGTNIGEKPIDNKHMEVGYQGIIDRKSQMEGGVKFQIRGPLTLSYELDLRYGEESGYSILKLIRPVMILGGFIILSPSVSIKTFLPQYNNYYFGVTDIEANNLGSENIEKAYDGDKMSFTKTAGLSLIIRFSRSGMLMILSEMQIVGKNIHRSPIVKKSTVLSGAVGITYNL